MSRCEKDSYGWRCAAPHSRVWLSIALEVPRRASEQGAIPLMLSGWIQRKNSPLLQYPLHSIFKGSANALSD
jgi:hypothetical protein